MVCPFRPMMRPTSLCLSCRRKTVVLPDGISVMIASSGNSTSWRTTNSRNSRILRGSLHRSRVGRARNPFFIFLHQLAHLIETLEQIVDFGYGAAASTGDPLTPPRIQNVGPTALF